MTTYYMHTHNGGGIGMSDGPCVVDAEYCNPRPGLWIDPEDHETFRVALEAWTQATFGYTATPGDLQVFAHALRRLIAPPKPPEPTAIWSVVEEANEDQWVRVLGPDFPDGWLRAGALPGGATWTAYADIAAVKVLSEGVTR